MTAEQIFPVARKILPPIYPSRLTRHSSYSLSIYRYSSVFSIVSTRNPLLPRFYRYILSILFIVGSCFYRCHIGIFIAWTRGLCRVKVLHHFFLNSRIVRQIFCYPFHPFPRNNCKSRAIIYYAFSFNVKYAAKGSLNVFV